MENKRFLLALAEDRVRAADEKNMMTYTDFLDPAEQSCLRAAFSRGAACGTLFYGGFEDAERVVMFCLPDYMTMGEELPEEICETLSVVRASHSERASASRSGRSLSHGDYLGALMGLGLKREKIGDILVRPDGADIIVLSEIADHIARELVSAGRSSLSTEVVPIEELILPARETQVFTDTVASLRLDNVLSAAFRISRSKASDAIRQGIVFVDHMEASKPDMQIAEGALLNIRHKGRARLAEIAGRSKKGRLTIKIERY